MGSYQVGTLHKAYIRLVWGQEDYISGLYVACMGATIHLKHL